MTSSLPRTRSTTELQQQFATTALRAVPFKGYPLFLPRKPLFPVGIKAAMVKAGEGYRTLVFSLEGCGSTIELHPQ